jgi:hypothetical protein
MNSWAIKRKQKGGNKMKKLTKKEAKAIFGTSLQGYIDISYSSLVNKFGAPTFPDGDGYKVDAEWVLTHLGTVITIYNYKDGKNYLGGRGKKKEKIRNWHIGGRGERAVDYLKKTFPNSKVTKR